MLNPLSDLHRHTLQLWYLVQHSISAFRKLEQYFGSVQAAVSPEHLARWSELKIHQNHLQRAQEFSTETGQRNFENCMHSVLQLSDFMVCDTETSYPQQLLPYTDRPPVLFGKGSLQNLSQPQVAIVGSRKPGPHGKQVAYDFAFYLSDKGFFITSGLAQGIDEAAHMGALKNHRTIAVIGTGLDQVYPSQNTHLQAQILQHLGSVITEFLPGTKPLQQHFPRRNRIVSGLSLGVLVAEAALDSGSLITARLAAEQGKTTFAIPGHIYSEHHRGCHQLIREGSILIDHPDQIIEDLALPTQWHYQQQDKATTAAEPTDTSLTDHDPTVLLSIRQAEFSPSHLPPQNEIPEHLFLLYQQLDWIGQDIDSLANKLNMPVAELTGNLMELELTGLCIQQAGLYLRCRNSF